MGRVKGNKTDVNYQDTSISWGSILPLGLMGPSGNLEAGAVEVAVPGRSAGLSRPLYGLVGANGSCGGRLDGEQEEGRSHSDFLSLSPSQFQFPLDSPTW